MTASALALAAVGCGTDLTAEGNRVRVGTAVPHPACQELGIVYGSGGGGMYVPADDKMRNAQNELRNNAAEKGGNFVVMDATGSDVRGISLTGRAFSCRNLDAAALPAAAPPPAAPPAAAPPAEERLRKLKALADQGLITPEEYEQRKKEILKDL